MDGDVFSEAVWPALKAELSSGWTTATPEALLLLIKSCKHHKVTDGFPLTV